MRINLLTTPPLIPQMCVLTSLIPSRNILQHRSMPTSIRHLTNCATTRHTRPRVDVLGLGSIGTFAAHSLFETPDPPSVTILCHRLSPFAMHTTIMEIRSQSKPDRVRSSSMEHMIWKRFATETGTPRLNREAVVIPSKQAAL